MSATAQYRDPSVCPVDFYYHIVGTIEFYLGEILRHRLISPDPANPPSHKEIDGLLRSSKSALEIRRKIAQFAEPQSSPPPAPKPKSLQEELNAAIADTERQIKAMCKQMNIPPSKLRDDDDDLDEDADFDHHLDSDFEKGLKLNGAPSAPSAAQSIPDTVSTPRSNLNAPRDARQKGGRLPETPMPERLQSHTSPTKPPAAALSPYDAEPAFIQASARASPTTCSDDG